MWASVILRNTILTRLLEVPAYFRRAFIQAGALVWPNGLGFSAHSLHRSWTRSEHYGVSTFNLVTSPLPSLRERGAA